MIEIMIYTLKYIIFIKNIHIYNYIILTKLLYLFSVIYFEYMKKDFYFIVKLFNRTTLILFISYDFIAR